MIYIILIAFAVFVFSCFGFFLFGFSKGKKSAQAEYAEDQLRRERDARDYERAKRDIKEEVQGNAEKEKAEIASHANARDRFNSINGKLSNGPKN